MTATLRLISPTSAGSWTEAEIKQLSQTDPRMAMEMVIRKYRDRLFYHAAGIVKDWQEAYDVVQEVFIRAMRETRLYNLDFKIKAWLFRVTTNLCFNLVRDRRRRGQILENKVRPPDRTYADQLDQVFSGERQTEVLAAIEKMTPNHREILMLRYYDELSYSEISDVLEVKLGTVMSRLSRARSRLLAEMGQDNPLRPSINN
jgi:RNA polymerase sigma-70 factor (ECF subfamily)